jgi:hypothetical protein
MSVEAIEPIAVVTDYDGLITALRQRAIALNTPLEAIDHVAGLPARYTTKLLGKTKVLGPMSLGAMLGALALKLAVMPDDDALAKLRHRLPPRDVCGRGPPLLAGPGVGRRKARTRRARELAAALARLQKGQRRRGAVTSVCGPSQSDVTCSHRPGVERQGNQPKDLVPPGFEAVLSGEGNHPAGGYREG